MKIEAHHMLLLAKESSIEGLGHFFLVTEEAELLNKIDQNVFKHIFTQAKMLLNIGSKISNNLKKQIMSDL